MKTEVLAGADLRRAVEALKNGEPVIFPTETVYGLAAPIFHKEAVKKIFTIKGRPQDNPLIAHISSLEEAEGIGEISDAFLKLAEAFWPGPLSIVVRKKRAVPEIVSAGLPTIAIRMPSHPIARSLIEEVGVPLVAPSANLSGKPSPTCLADCLEDLDGKVRLAVDGGECEVGIESTVIGLLPEPVYLRPGAITKEAIEKVLGQTVSDPLPNGPILSPGMKYRHYAPKAKVHLCFRKEEWREPLIQPNAKTLYALLRDADRKNVSDIYVDCNEQIQKDAAIMNRLLRASGQIH
ncbi:MAG: threonylcarbamoyl-AMP synthase [Verrucomicrobia bacterium]|nr:threonylcarbamoyl-AMP synthase [Verrucomicrobiota bacterium]MDE3047379.1 threonylcarbamoyl-AMP synthase [Verrucomicrobiota bacterium]